MALLEPKPQRVTSPEELDNLEQEYEDTPALSQLTGPEIERLRGLFNKLSPEQFVELAGELDYRVPKGAGDGRFDMAIKRVLANIDRPAPKQQHEDGWVAQSGKAAEPYVPMYLAGQLDKAHPAVKAMRDYLAARDAYTNDIAAYRERKKSKGLKTGVPRLMFGGAVSDEDMGSVWQMLDDAYGLYGSNHGMNAATEREAARLDRAAKEAEWDDALGDRVGAPKEVEYGDDLEEFEDDLPDWSAGPPPELAAEDVLAVDEALRKMKR